jgi:hypothetical protein
MKTKTAAFTVSCVFGIVTAAAGQGTLLEKKTPEVDKPKTEVSKMRANDGAKTMEFRGEQSSGSTAPVQAPLEPKPPEIPRTKQKSTTEPKPVKGATTAEKKE